MAGGLLGGLARGLGGLLLGLALGALFLALDARFENLAALGLAGDDGGIVGIVFGTRQKLLRHRLAGFGGGFLAVLELVRVQERHCYPD